MRVIAGEYKGRRLKAVPGQNTRPTTDKVKESIFNIIGPYFEGGMALDLFAGTGGLGIESLSRGIVKAVFIEKDYKAVSVIRENIAMLGLEMRSEIQKNDAKRALDGLAERGVQFDLVFLDPPYKLVGMYGELILRMQELGLFHNRAYVVAEHASDVTLPDRIGSAVRWRHAVYGEVSVSFYEVGEAVVESGSDEEGMTE